MQTLTVLRCLSRCFFIVILHILIDNLLYLRYNKLVMCVH